MADKKDEVGGGMEDRVLDYDTTTPVLDEDSVDPVYKAKAHVLNNAIQNIGMGRYQWELVSLFFLLFQLDVISMIRMVV